MRSLRAATVFALTLAACAPANSGSDGGADAAASDAAPAPSVHCIDRTCAGSQAVCCFDLSFTPPFLSGQCAAAAVSCDQNAFTCDDVTDCAAGQRCCAGSITVNGMPEAVSSCRAACGADERELCDVRGPGRCASGGFCCFNSGDNWGRCAPTEGDCAAFARDQ